MEYLYFIICIYIYRIESKFFELVYIFYLVVNININNYMRSDILLNESVVRNFIGIRNVVFRMFLWFI